MSKLLRRATIRQADIVEWALANKSEIHKVRHANYTAEKGFVAYFNDGVKMVQEFRGSKEKEDDKSKSETTATTATATTAADAADGANKEVAAAASTSADAPAKKGEEKEEKKPGINAVQQYYHSQDLLKRMKWKRVTWDEDADYEAFARRLLDSDGAFNKVDAFSFMSFHITKDKNDARLASFQDAMSDGGSFSLTQIKPGSLTNWFQERTPKIVPEFQPSANKRQQPFTVDWRSGEARILDSATAQDMLIFLETTAPRLQAMQVKMEQEQEKFTEDVENVRVRLNLQAFKFNKFDRSFWDDPERKKDPDYVDPEQLRMAINSLLKASLLYRVYFKRTVLRVVPSGRPYVANTKDNEIQIPANFGEFGFLTCHQRYESLERIFNGFRAYWWISFLFCMMLVGDLEIL